MSRGMCRFSIFVALCCVLFGTALAQTQNCADAPVMSNINLTQFLGTWFEAARNPAGSLQCVEADFTTSSDNAFLYINVTSSNTPSALWQNSSMIANVTLSGGSINNGFNVSYNMSGMMMPNVTLKLLDTDYNNYAFVCGFTNVSDQTTYFGAVLTRLRVPAMSDLMSYEANATSKFSNFNTNMSLITQTDECYTPSSAIVSQAPALTLLLAAFYALLKYFN